MSLLTLKIMHKAICSHDPLGPGGDIMHLCYRPYIVRLYGSDSCWVRKVLSPIRLGSEKVLVRVVQKILGPSRLEPELTDIR